MRGLYNSDNVTVVIIAAKTPETMDVLLADMNMLNGQTVPAVPSLGRWEGLTEDGAVAIVLDMQAVRHRVLHILRTQEQLCALVVAPGRVYTLWQDGHEEEVGERLVATQTLYGQPRLGDPMLDSLPSACTVMGGRVYEVR